MLERVKNSPCNGLSKYSSERCYKGLLTTCTKHYTPLTLGICFLFNSYPVFAPCSNITHCQTAVPRLDFQRLKVLQYIWVKFFKTWLKSMFCIPMTRNLITNYKVTRASAGRRIGRWCRGLHFCIFLISFLAFSVYLFLFAAHFLFCWHNLYFIYKLNDY